MNPTLSTPQAPMSDGDRLQRFLSAARAVVADVEQVPRSAEALASVLSRIAERYDSARMVIAEARDLPNVLLDACRKLPGVIAGRSRQEMAAADIGVTDTFAAVASTGTVCVRIDSGDAGYASLLVRTHVAIVAPERIVDRPGDLFREDCLSGEGLREDFVYISGPSATADMGPLVRGVHGPHFLHILVLTG